MKKLIKSSVLFLFLLLFMSSCKEKLELSTKNVEFDFKENQAQVDVVSNAAWKVESSADWCVIPIDSGLKNGSFNLILSPNISKEERMTTILITGGETLRDSLFVKQTGVSDSDENFNLESESLFFEPGSSSEKVLLTSVGKWELDLASKPAWINVDPTSGEGTSNVKITVDQNKLLIDRNSSLVFTNAVLEKAIMFEVKQAAQKSTILSDYKYLGKGFDASTDVGYDAGVCDMVLDWNKLANKGYISEVIYPNLTHELYYYGKTASKYQENMSVSAGLDANYKGFTASVKSSFSNSTLTSQENEFASFIHVTEKALISLSGNINAEKLRECMTNSAYEDINNPNVSPATIIEKYGTHVIPSFFLGVSLNYSLTADMQSTSEEADWSLAVKGGYQSVIGGATVSSSVREYEKIEKYGVNKEERLTAKGGESQYTSIKGKDVYNKWLKSIESPKGWTLVDFGKLSLIPIWKLTANKDRQAVLQKHIENHLKGITLNPSSTHKKFSIKMRDAKYLGDENNQSGNTQDVVLSQSTITVNNEPKVTFINNLLAPRLPNRDDSNNFNNKYRSFKDVSMLNGLTKDYSLSKEHSNVVKLHFYADVVKCKNGTGSADVTFTYNKGTDRWNRNDTNESYANGESVQVRIYIGKDDDVLIRFRIYWE